MGSVLSSQPRNKFGETLFVSSKLRNAAWMLSSIPELRTMFIQYLKDKKWVNLYLDRMHIDIDDIDDKIPMASKYHFPPELLELFSNPDTTDHNAELPTSPNVNMDIPIVSPESSPMPHMRLQTILAVDDSPCVSTREDLHPPQGGTDAPLHPSLTTLQSTVFALSSALNVPPVAPNNNITSIQSRIQQDLKLLIIAGVLLIFVDSKGYKQWIRHHMSLITLSEFCQQELEQSLRSLRNNFAPRSHRQMRGYVRLKKQSNSASTPRKVKIYALHSRFSGRSPSHNRRSSPTHLHLIHPALPVNSTLSLEEEKESQKMRTLQEQERARRKQKHRERLKRVIFAALSLPVSGGQTLRHLLSTSRWLDAMLQFIHNLPVGIGISSTSALLFHQERAHITAPSQSQAGCLWCQPVREDCPILYVNQEVETVAEVARADIVGYNLGHFLAMQYQERNAPMRRRSQSAPSTALVNVSTSNSTTVLPNPSIDMTKISNQREEDGDESSSDPLYASSPYPLLKLDMASAETHKPFSNVDPILQRFRELELDFTVIQKPIYFAYSQKHHDGRRYWHFVKCLPIHRTQLEVLSEYSDGSVSFTNATSQTKSQTVADHRTNGSDDKDSSSPENVEDSKIKKSGFNVKVDAANWPTVGALDGYETAFSPDGVYHILSSHIIIPDVSIAQPMSHSSSSSNSNNHHHHHRDHNNNSSNSSSHKNIDIAFESNMAGQIPGQSVTKGRFTPSYTHHLAKDLQVIDDFLFVLSALF